MKALRYWPFFRSIHQWISLKGPHQTLYYWLFVRESTGGRWIPLTKGQSCRKCFHAMPSSCLTCYTPPFPKECRERHVVYLGRGLQHQRCPSGPDRPGNVAEKQTRYYCPLGLSLKSHNIRNFEIRSSAYIILRLKLTPLLIHWTYRSLPLNHRYNTENTQAMFSSPMSSEDYTF